MLSHPKFSYNPQDTYRSILKDVMCEWPENLIIYHIQFERNKQPTTRDNSTWYCVREIDV